MKTMKLADGRTLAYDDYGDPRGKPVVFTHGFGDSRLIRNRDNHARRSGNDGDVRQELRARHVS